MSDTTAKRGASVKAASDSATAVRVLVVEDDADTRYAVEVSLSARGYQVFLAEEGDSIVAVVQELHPDVIVLDLGLPGMNGIQVLQSLQVVSPRPHTIVLSGWVGERYETEALEAGAVLYLEKPIEADQLVAAIREFSAPA